MKRALVLVLGLLYLLQATWLLQGGVDLLIRGKETVKRSAASCCTNGCGCPEDAKERKHCCCFPERDKTAEAPVEVPVSAIEEARCQGKSDSTVDLVSIPALTGPELVLPVPTAGETVELLIPLPDFPSLDRSVEKVPI